MRVTLWITTVIHLDTQNQGLTPNPDRCDRRDCLDFPARPRLRPVSRLTLSVAACGSGKIDKSVVSDRPRRLARRRLHEFPQLQDVGF